MRLSYERGHALPIPAPCPSPRARADPNEVTTLLIKHSIAKGIDTPRSAQAARARNLPDIRERILVSARESFACNGIDRTFP